jgi:uncharacterized repeat protein (TIGR03803 family)
VEPATTITTSIWRNLSPEFVVKTSIKNLFRCLGGAWAYLGVASKRSRILPALIASLGLILAGQVAAQTFTTLSSFTNSSDGSNPHAGLILSGNTLFGTTAYGGTYGTVFAGNTDGTGFTNLHSFIGGNGEAYFPYGGLILSGNTLYGTAEAGGFWGGGTVFAVNTNGSGFTNLHSFTNSDGPYRPDAGLILSSNTLYGTTVYGGSSEFGTVFAVKTDGTRFATLHSFTAPPPSYSTNCDGFNPEAGLILSGNTLYGTARGGGSSGFGTLFAVNTDGSGFTNLHSLTSVSDGANPYAGLILSDNTLYGTAFRGGSVDNGTVFAVNTDGTGFTNLHNFAGYPSDGANPYAGLILSDNTLYGTAFSGGSEDNGTVFSLSLPGPPQLSIILSGAKVILTWPTNAAGLTLQSTRSLLPADWTTISLSPVVVSGQNIVTNPIFGTQQFFRLGPLAIPSGMALIPAGTFTMGDTLDGESDAIPTVTVNVSVFYMDTNLVSYSQWQPVYNWATANGYGFDNAGAGKAANHPVQTVNWYDTVKWSNALSQQAGLIPVYYMDASLTQVYTTGDVDAVYANWAANGYRLPTETEWEKAARGGLSGQRFPWGNTIFESQANYYGNTNDYSYDLGPNGLNAEGLIGGSPYTSPVGYFASNGYGLYDMAGNLLEWCWDWYGTPYAGGSNPCGPASSPYGFRVLRGGYWGGQAGSARCAYRGLSTDPGNDHNYFGFRCVRRL